MVLFSAHLCGCAFYAIHLIELHFDSKNTWVHYIGIENDGWFDKYVSSFYFAIITMITVGFGDIYP